MNSVVKVALSAIAAIAGLVTLWSLAGFVGVMAYRDGQIAAHSCLVDAPLPEGLFGTGVVAFVVAVASVALAFLGRGFSRAALVWVSALFLTVTVPLLAVSVAVNASTEQPQNISRNACIGDDRTEGTQ